jgi:very-short-patch-repair endonuclease
MHPPDRTVDELIAELASGTHGVVTRAGLTAAGLTGEQIKTRLRRGSLIRIHPGVYRVGHAAPSAHASFIAAVVACGEGAVLSGRAAAWLLGLVPGRAPTPEVTCPTERRLEEVKTRRARDGIPRQELTVVAGIPTTSPARTLVDLAADLSEAALARACHEAGVRYRTTPGDIEDVLTRKPNAYGVKRLRRVIHGGPVSLSKLESSFNALLKKHRFPTPLTNRLSTGKRVDCRWPDHKLIIELDSHAFHNSRHSWEQDRARERRARAAGFEHRRYTWVDVVENPTPTVRELRKLLSPSAS